MLPLTLHTERLVLDLPVAHDRDLIVAYCRDPLFETFMTLPWPYRVSDADYFLDTMVPDGWRTGSELTWALRHESGGALLGVISWRAESESIGFWIGAPHRGKGLMSEATHAVIGWVFETLRVPVVRWECKVGNAASVGVARKTGFTYDGERPTTVEYRGRTHPLSWYGVLRPGDDRAPKPGWPV